MRKWLIFLLVLTMLGIGIYFAVQQCNAKPPSPTITVGDKEVAVAQGSYCWNGFLNSICADTISPLEMMKHQELKPVVVSPKSQLKIKFKNKPKENTLRVNRWLSNEEIENVPLNDNILTIPKEKGVYIYDISARWEKGDSSYAFAIEVR